jgi:twinkle protein
MWHPCCFQAGARKARNGVRARPAAKRDESLKVHLTGDKAGIWQDFATGEGGDLLDLWGTKSAGCR